MLYNSFSALSYSGQFGVYLTSVGFVLTTVSTQLEKVTSCFTSFAKMAAKKANAKKAKAAKAAPQQATK